MKRQHAEGPGDKELIIPGWSTFFRAWTDGWQKLLKFRKKSQHSECTICAESRLKLHDKNLSSEERIAEAAKWRRHLVDQYHDRLLYWSLRYASRHMMNILVPKLHLKSFQLNCDNLSAASLKTLRYSPLTAWTREKWLIQPGDLVRCHHPWICCDVLALFLGHAG